MSASRCYACDVPLGRGNVSPVTDDACKQCAPDTVTDFEVAEAKLRDIADRLADEIRDVGTLRDLNGLRHESKA